MEESKMKIIHRTAISVVAVAVILIAAVIGWTVVKPEQTTAPNPEPLVINTVQRQDDMLLTVIREDETVFQYEGDVQLWKGADGKAYGIIYLDEEVLQ